MRGIYIRVKSCTLKLCHYFLRVENYKKYGQMICVHNIVFS